MRIKHIYSLKVLAFTSVLAAAVMLSACQPAGVIAPTPQETPQPTLRLLTHRRQPARLSPHRPLVPGA